MTQEELWLKKYQEVKAFIETNHRNPSRHNPEERFKYCNWVKRFASERINYYNSTLASHIKTVI